MAPSSDPNLSRRERQIMDILYERGECSARDVLAALPDNPAYSTVRALLAVLGEKGHVRHSQKGSRYIYSPVQGVARARDSALHRLLKIFFGGSTVKAVTALVGMKEESLTDEELAELSELIERARANRK